MIKHNIELYLHNSSHANEDVCQPYQLKQIGFSCQLAPVVEAMCNYAREHIEPCDYRAHSWATKKVCAESQLLQSMFVLFSLFFFLYLFMLMTEIADGFFFANLEVIMKRYEISEDIAGITLVAFGNGTPDLLSTLESVVTVKHPEVGVAVSELLGGGIFVTTIVLAGVIFIRRSEIKIWSAVRDIGFYFIALGTLIYVVMSGRMLRVWKPMMFLAIYGLYWAVILARKLWTSKKKNGKSKDKSCETRSLSFVRIQANGTFALPPPTKPPKPIFCLRFSHHIRTLLEHLNPIDVETFRKDGIVSRTAAILKAPCLVVVKLSVPLAIASWCKPLAVVHVFTAPIFFLAAFQLLDYQFCKSLPGIWAVSSLLSSFAAAAILCCTTLGHTPKYYKEATSMAGFVVSVAWIYATANEVVDVVMVLGHLLGVPYEILLLTAVTWMNSLGDLVADLSIARRGYTQMAFSAAIGGPLFNLLVGFGSTFVLAKLQGKGVTLDVDVVEQTMFVTTAVGLCSTLILLFIFGSRTTHFHAFYLCTLYVVFTVMAILAVHKVLWYQS